MPQYVNPIGNGNDMAFSRSGMSPEEIFGDSADEGFRSPARGLSRSGGEYIPIEDVADPEEMNPETVMISREEAEIGDEIVLSPVATRRMQGGRRIICRGSASSYR